MSGEAGRRRRKGLSEGARGLLRRLSPSRFFPEPAPDPCRRMRAVVFDRSGGPEVLALREVPAPAPSPEHLLVEVRAAGINPVDVKLRSAVLPGLVYPLPTVPGSDLCGIVRDAPEGSGFRAGDRVYAMLPLLGSRWGASAALAPVPPALASAAPTRVDDAGAASLPLVALTVVQAMAPVVRAWGGRSQGRRALVQGGSGGVGTFAVQYCRRVLGMQVAATCGARNVEWLRSLGADPVVDYARERFEDEVGPCDVVIDPFGHLYEARTLSSGLLGPGAHYVRIAGSSFEKATGATPRGSIPEASPGALAAGFAKVGWYTMAAAAGARPRYHLVFVRPDGATLRDVARWVDEERIEPVVERVWPLDSAADAHRELEQGHTRGKLVLRVSDAAPPASGQAGDEPSSTR